MACSPTFCILPWIHRFTNIGGEIQVCCTSEEYDNQIRDENGRTLRAPEDLDDERIMNSPTLRAVRRRMLAGEWPELCARCRITEESGGLSRRQSDNARFAEHIEAALAGTHADGSIQVKVIQSDFRLGNLCNLACRMCSPRASSRWLAESLPSDALKEFASYRWFESERLIEHFRRQLPTLEWLHFAGGEPLISKRMIDILRECVEAGRARSIQLSYNTNLTKIPAELKDLWPRFGGVHLYCSVDAVGPLNELIRHPSRWADIDRNLRYIDQHHEVLGIREALVACTVQIHNVLRLAELYDYLEANFTFVSQIPYLVDLYTPPHYQTTVLPPELKALAARRMEAIAEKARRGIQEGRIPERISPLLETLRGSLNFMQSQDQSAMIPEFRRKAESLDAQRGESIYKVVPELNFLKL